MDAMRDNIPDCFYRVSVKALITDNDGRFLLIQEENGLWELPGGGLDFGESPAQGIRRELMEEMGLQATYIADQPAYFFPAINPKGQHIVNAVYFTEVTDYSEFIPSLECKELQFFTVADVLGQREKMYPNILEFVKYYKY